LPTMKIIRRMKKCEKCGKEHQKNGRFCSRSCANSRIWSEEDKLKKSNSANSSEKVQKENESRKKRFLKECKICNNKFETIKGIYCSNKCRSSDKLLTEQKNIKISLKAIERFKLFPHLHPNRLCAGINESYPEKMFREFLEQNGLIDGEEFKQQYRVSNYYVDFYFPKLKLGVEIDGERWHQDLVKESIREQEIIKSIKLLRFKAIDIIKRNKEKEILELIKYISEA
jgi:very-short-patch-repair endonuclease